MEFHKIKKITIVTEASILDDIIDISWKMGAEGYTVDRIVGKGESGVRLGYDISGMLDSVRIDIVTNEDIAKKIAVEVENKFFTNYAGILYLQDIEVTHLSKFGLSK